jgi:hypothetical protein
MSVAGCSIASEENTYSLRSKLQVISRILESQNIFGFIKIIKKITKNITSNKYTMKI